MHTFRFVFPVLIALLLCAGPVRSQTTEDPSDQYFRAYVMNNEAARIAQSGDLQQAIDKYTQAQAIFDSIAKTAPTWQPDMLKFRRDRVMDAVATLKTKLASQPPPAPAPAPAPAAPVAAPIPAAPSYVPAPAPAPGIQSAPGAPTAGIPTMDAALQAVKQAMEAQMAPVQQQLTEALADVGRRQLAYETVVKQRDQVAEMYKTLGQTATGQQAKITDLEKQVAGNANAAADLTKLKEQQTETAAQLAETKARLTKAESSVMKQSTGLMTTTSRLEALQVERNELAKKLDAAVQEREILTQQRDKMTTERNTATTELASLKAATPVIPSNLKELTEENARLHKDLDEARRQVDSLKSDASRKDQEIAQLKGKVEQIQGELVSLKKENASYESQVSELTVQLKQIRSSIDNPKKSKGNDSPQMMAENQLLRGIILRQLRQQARQQQQKAGVIAEIQKTANASKELIDQVEQLGGSRFTLSDDEQKLFTVPQLKEIAGEGGIQATIMDKSSKPATDKSSDVSNPLTVAASGTAAVDGLLEKGNQALQDNKFADAASAYQEVLRADPKNGSGFVGLAWAQVQQDKLKDAEATLKKSLAYDPTNATAHYMLGVTLFRTNQMNEAMTSFQKSLDLNGKNARARHYLGVIASKMGLSERAEREFKAALAIDPTYGDAFFNLAVLYATWDPPKWDEARTNYNEALKNHVKANPDLEKILKEDAPAVSKR